MDPKDFDVWLVQLINLTKAQRDVLMRSLSLGQCGKDAKEVLNQRAAEVQACPHCQSGEVIRWGSAAGMQRYRCKSCHRTFGATTGTPLARLKRRDAWLAYGQAMLDGLSVRKAAAKAGVHRTTSFRWRHRMLQLPATENDTELSGIVEADETYFLESFKGQRNLPRPPRHRGGHAQKQGLSAEQIPVLVMQDRQGKHYDNVLSKADACTLGCLLPQLLAPESVLCTDGAKVYRTVTKAQAIPHEALNLSAGTRVKRRVFHVQHVNAYDSRLKRWMARFNGVATKYLHHYLGWRRLLERGGVQLNPAALIRHAMG